MDKLQLAAIVVAATYNKPIKHLIDAYGVNFWIDIFTYLEERHKESTYYMSYVTIKSIIQWNV